MRVASPAPRAMGRNGGSSPARPSFRAYSMPDSRPTAWSVFTAGMLRLCSTAWRTGMGPRYLRSEFWADQTVLFQGFGNEIGEAKQTLAGLQVTLSPAPHEPD